MFYYSLRANEMSQKWEKWAKNERNQILNFCRPWVDIYGKPLLTIIGQENVFYDILKRRNAFIGNKNNTFIVTFPWFWSRIGHFSNFFFLGIIGQENVFYDILKRKNAFLGYKNKNFNEEKLTFFQRGYSMVWFLNWPFFKILF